MTQEIEQFELEIGKFTYVITKANYKPDTWIVKCSLTQYTFFDPALEKWSPFVTITCQHAGEVETKLIETLQFIETKLDPVIPRKS